MTRRTFRPLVGSFAARPLIPVGLALVLLLVSLLLGIQNERGRLDERLRASRVQAEVLARSVAAPLAFDDVAAIEGYLGALDANANLRAAGAYGQDGALRAGFARPGLALPPRVRGNESGREAGDIVWLVPVDQNGTRFGSVYLRYATESLSRRWSRYVGVALLLGIASLLIAALGLAYASLSRAHRQLRDQTAQREKAEESLRQAQKMEAMGQLTGGVAHDFNNLLMVASSGLDLLERTNDPERRERLKAGIRQAIDRGAKLTQQLLTFARKSPLKPEVIDVKRTVCGLEDLLNRSLREDIRVEMRFEPGLCPVEVDASQFEVALLNVTLNARDAMTDGGVIRIEADLVPEQGDRPAMVRLAVIDTGAGVAEADLHKVFEPFYTTKEVGRGTGLGLSQVYGFARSSGGEVGIESQVGHGTTVFLLLPCSDKPLPNAVQDADAAASASGRERRVLLVEDDDQVAALVGEMLGELGYHHERASSASAALDQLASGSNFDLVFSDMVMPGTMGGLDLARELGRRRPGLPVVLTSGYSEAASAAIAESRQLLAKPYSIRDLSTALAKALEHG